MAQKGRTGFLVALGLIVLTALVGLARGACAETVLKVGGTGTALGTMRLLAEAFARSHPGTKVKILPSLGSSGGIKALLGGGVDLAVSSRPLKEEERRAGAVQVEYARSPFVFTANRKVPSDGITTAELERIYNGQLATWPDGTRIRLIIRPEGETDTKIARGISPAMDKAVIAALSRPGMIMAVTDQECAEAVEKTSGALGGGTLTEIMTESRPVKVLSFNGVKPSVKALADRSYPLAKSLYLVATPKSPPDAVKFAEFVRSPAGRSILAKSGNLVPETR